MAPEVSNIPPVVIVHLIRHAQSAKPKYPGAKSESESLSAQGEIQCDDLSSTITAHVPYITHILSSPIGRCLETARKSFSRHLRSGLKIQIMPALAGLRGSAYKSATSDHHAEVCDVWIEEQATSRIVGSKPEDFVMDFLRLKDLSATEAGKVKEVVIVTHGAQLNSLLGRNYKDSDFPNAKLRTYLVYTGDKLGAFVHLRNDNILAMQRGLQTRWETQFKTRQADEEKKLDEEKRLVEQKKLDEANKLEETKKLEAKIREALLAEELATRIKHLLAIQDKLEVVDVATNQIVTLEQLIILLRIRHRAEMKDELRGYKGKSRKVLTLMKDGEAKQPVLKRKR